MSILVNHLNVTVQNNPILSDICFYAGQAQTIGLLGPNGSGKSTLIRSLAGLFPASSDRIQISGTALCKFPRGKLARTLAFVPQHAEADNELSVIEIVRLGRTPHRGAFSRWRDTDNQVVHEALMLMQLNDLANRPWQNLSGGERQRCQIARALAQKPDILLLDEPVNHLDIQFQLELMRLITALPITVIIALHDLNLAARYCQHLVILRQGEVVATGSPASVLTPELILNTWQVHALVNHTEKGIMNVQYA
ncbi:ABC transporter ATP-binding protein [Enterobacter asburiae]|nr:ABC transporter ATP-binding protein [Enterobacter asburiae]